MTTSADYRIEGVQVCQYQGTGTRVKLFRAYVHKPEQRAFVFCGAFSAPARTANRDLWKIVALESQP